MVWQRVPEVLFEIFMRNHLHNPSLQITAVLAAGLWSLYKTIIHI
jgi:hypothetical protein